MFKKLFLVLGFVFALCVSALALDQFVSYPDTLITDFNAADSTNYSPEFGIVGAQSLGAWFKIIQADTAKTDSYTVAIQSKPRGYNYDWETIYTFTEMGGAVASKYMYFPLDGGCDSNTYMGFYDDVRLMVVLSDSVTADDADSETIYPNGEGVVQDWVRSTGGTEWGTIDETTPSATDYDSTATVTHWLTVHCGPHTKHENTIDSVKAHFYMGYVTAACSVQYGIMIADSVTDTTTALRSMSASTVLGTTLTTAYHKNFPLDPRGAAWTQGTLDSLGLIIKSQYVGTGGIIKLSAANATVFYHKGTFSPPVIFRTQFYRRD